MIRDSIIAQLFDQGGKDGPEYDTGPSDSLLFQGSHQLFLASFSYCRLNQYMRPYEGAIQFCDNACVDVVVRTRSAQLFEYFFHCSLFLGHSV